MRNMLHLTTAILAISAAAVSFGAEPNPASPWPFFVFDDGTGGPKAPLEPQAQMLKDLGYDGIQFTGTAKIPEMLAALDARGLKMYALYIETHLDRDQPYDPALKTAIEQLKGRKTQIWLTIIGGKPSAENLDDRAVGMIREIADMAEQSGLRVSLYPHHTCYVERFQDGVRLVKKVNRKNVGVNFNLCHFLKCDDENLLEQRLQEAMPYLFAVSINGADAGQRRSRGWRRLIQTLDRGTFDVGRVLRALKRLGYQGAIGLQCFDIPGEPRDNLTRSMAAWRKLVAKLDAASEAKPQKVWPFYAFDNGTGGVEVPFDKQVAMLKELGYDGIAYSGRLPLNRLPEMLKAIDAQGLKMYFLYAGVYADPAMAPGRDKFPYDPILKRAIEQLKGRETQIWIAVVGGRPRSDDLDDQVVPVLREIADMAQKAGLKVALYPHINWYAERVENCVRLAKKVDRKNLGVVFNLCHFLIRDDEPNLEPRLKEAAPYLFGVSVSGADSGYKYSKDWTHLVMTVDRGNFDIVRMLRPLKQLGYEGPIGVQCHDLQGDPRENMTHSMAGWRKLVDRVNAETPGYNPIGSR